MISAWPPGERFKVYGSLATAARFHERFKEQAGDDPEVRAERAYAYFELASIATQTGAAEEALGHFRQSLALWGPLVEAHPDSREYRRDALATSLSARHGRRSTAPPRADPPLGGPLRPAAAGARRPPA